MTSRLNLATIEAALTERADAEACAGLGGPDEVFTADVARRLIEGYRHIDWLLATGRNPLSIGDAKEFLELNLIVLCGRSLDRRAEHAAHIAATKQRFYGNSQGGAAAFYEWLKRRRYRNPVSFAARLYVRIVSSPQLFVEGNQRTAALAASYVLAAGGVPPFVIDTSLASAFAPVAAVCRAVDRQQWGGTLKYWLAVRALQRFLAAHPGERFSQRAGRGGANVEIEAAAPQHS